MKYIITFISLLLLQSCFPSKQVTRPDILVSVIDRVSKKPVSNARVTYTPLPNSWKKGDKIPPEIKSFSYLAPYGSTTIKGSSSFGIFWIIQEPLSSAYRITGYANGYDSRTIENRVFTHGPFGPKRINQTIYIQKR